MRRALLRVPSLLAPVVLLICLAISALYELLEFGAAMALGQGAEAFLGTQGDVWDTQWDMLMCLAGAAVSLATLGRWHDAMCRRLPAAERPSTPAR